MWPGWTKSPPVLLGSASRRIVRARSAALMPVVMPSAASTVTVKSVRKASRFSGTMLSRPSWWAMSSDTGTQSMPPPSRTMKVTISGVIFSAAQMRSPSFSRSSSSVTMTMRPARMSAITDSTGSQTVLGERGMRSWERAGAAGRSGGIY
jgi:hypothetical protein